MFEPGARIARLDSGGVLYVPTRAVFTDERLRITIVIDVANGTIICPSYSVERIDGAGGLEALTTDVSRGLKIRNLMAYAAASAAVTPAPDDDERGRDFLPGQTLEAIEAVIGPIRRTREPVTDERLRAIADAYRERWIPGRDVEFAESFHMSDRNMRRMLKKARERGFLEAE